MLRTRWSSQCPKVLIQWQDSLKYIMYIYLCEYLICQPAVFVRKLLDRIQSSFDDFLIKSLNFLIKSKFYIDHYSEKQVLKDKKMI